MIIRAKELLHKTLAERVKSTTSLKYRRAALIALNRVRKEIQDFYKAQAYATVHVNEANRRKWR